MGLGIVLPCEPVCGRLPPRHPFHGMWLIEYLPLLGQRRDEGVAIFLEQMTSYWQCTVPWPLGKNEYIRGNINGRAKVYASPSGTSSTSIDENEALTVNKARIIDPQKFALLRQICQFRLT